MLKRRQIFQDSLKNKADNYNIISSWCRKNGLFVRTNKESFLVDNRILIRPEFIINETIFIDIMVRRKINSDYKEYCRLFSASFGVIIVIPSDSVHKINQIDKAMFNDRFGKIF
jgi:hypothetical protein